MKRRKKRKRRVKRKRRRAKRIRKRNEPRVKVHPAALQKTAAAILSRRNVLERKPKIKARKRETPPVKAAPGESVMTTNSLAVCQNGALQHTMSGTAEERKLTDHQRTKPDGMTERDSGRRTREVKRNAGVEREGEINETKAEREEEINETRAEEEEELNKTRAEGDIIETEAGALRDGGMRDTERMRDRGVPARREGGRK